MRAIGYIRVSTQSQVGDSGSLAMQESKIRAWATLRGTEVLIFRDEGISGKRSDNRPGLQAALKSVRRGDAFVCYSLSRLSRSTKDTLALSEALTKKGTDLVSLCENIDTTTAAGKMMFRVLAVISEFEYDQVSECTRLALENKKSRGEKTGGDVPFGFKSVDGKLCQHDEEQQTILLAKRLRDQGKSLRDIGRILETAGRLPRIGRVWHPQTILRIVRP